MLARLRSPLGSEVSGSISALGPDRWLVGVEGPPDPVTGERRRYTKVVRGERSAAEVAVAHLRLTVDRGEAIVATNARTVEAACSLYLSETRTESQTVRTDRSACKRICSTVLPGGQRFGELTLAKLDWRRIEEMYAKWEGQLDATTRARYASTLSKVLEHAKRCGWVRTNIAAQARRPKVPSHKPDVPVTSEVREALARVGDVDFNLYAYVMGLSTIGCRRSELLALTVGDCDLEGRVVTIRASLADGGPGIGIYRKATKRDDWRDVPMTEQLAEVFTDLFEIRRRTWPQRASSRRPTASCSATNPTAPAGCGQTRRASAGLQREAAVGSRWRCFAGTSPRSSSTSRTATTPPWRRSPATARRPSSAGTTPAPTSKRSAP